MGKKQQPLVSVIIPTYKDRGGLEEAINSVLNQDYNELEIIVIDDNFPDSLEREQTIKVMDKFKDNPSVTYFCHSENKNGAAARNTGINLSKGCFISFLDDDDSFYSTKISLQVKFLQKEREYNAVYCLAEKNGIPIKNIPYIGNVTKELLLLDSYLQTSTLMFRRKALLEINGFDESFRRHQDYELMLRFFNKGGQVGCVESVLVKIGMNRGENQLTSRDLEKLKEKFLSKFESYIVAIDMKNPGFAQRVYAKHYTGVFLKYLKEFSIYNALRVFFKCHSYAPKEFWRFFIKSIKQHLC